jgi:hypothetical protein
MLPSVCTLFVLSREDAIALVNVDPDVVHENSSLPFSRSLRSRKLFSSYLTPYCFSARKPKQLSLPNLPVPTVNWIEAFNTQCRKLNIAVRDRPLRALATWAKENGQDRPWKELWLSHAASDAFGAIYTYFYNHTSYPREQNAITLRKACFYYEDTFWKVWFSPVAGMLLVADVTHCVHDLPPSVRRLLEGDESAKADLRSLWEKWIYNGVNSHLFEPPRVPAQACAYFRGGEKSLTSAVADLLCDPPNPKAAEQCRDVFECALKALATAKGGLTRGDMKKSVSHDLRKLVNCCAALVGSSEKSRLE